MATRDLIVAYERIGKLLSEAERAIGKSGAMKPRYIPPQSDVSESRMAEELSQIADSGKRMTDLAQGPLIKELRRTLCDFLGEVLAADKVELEAWASYARVLLTANEFFYVD